MTRTDRSAWQPLVAGPRAVTLMLTTRCNLACAYCPQRRGPPHAMSARTLEAAVRLVARTGHARPKLVLFGGEPLLEKGLVFRALDRLARHARPGLAPDVRIVTNGLLLDDETTDRLEELGVTVELSCDGLPEAQERRGPDTPARLYALLLRLASRQPGFLDARLVARLTLDSGNVACLSRSFDSLVQLGVREIQPAPVYTPDPGWDDACAETLDAELERVVDEALDLGPADGRFAFGPLRGVPVRRPQHSRAACSLGSPDVLFVDVDGRVAPCGAFADSVNPSIPTLAEELRGPLRGPRVAASGLEDSLARRWETATRLPLLHPASDRNSPRDTCASCEALPECFVCPASIAFAPEQDPCLVPAIQCDWNRLVAKHRRAFQRRLASREADLQRAGSSSSAAATSAVTPARIDGA